MKLVIGRFIVIKNFYFSHIKVYKTSTRSQRWATPGCDELEERGAREMVIHALFDFLTQQVVLFTYRTCTYIGKIDNARHSSVAVTEEKGYRVTQRERDR
jgi:hypothetical protein